MKFIFTIYLFCFLLVGCTYQEASKVAPAENSFGIGEKFRICLPENHKTGYVWQINNSFDSKIIDYYGSIFRGKDKGVDFNFKALENGKTTIKFALIYYKDTAEVKQFIIDVN